MDEGPVLATVGRDIHTRSRVGGAAPARARRWGIPHLLALLAVPIGCIELWTVIAWIADGPTQSTRYRDTTSISWYAAHACEIGAAIVAILVLVHLYRDCKTKGRFLTFDVMLCLACSTLWWADHAVDFFAPGFLVSSNFINLNSPLGHLPFKINPALGAMPDSIVFFFLVETFGILGAALLVEKLLRSIRAKWPDITRGREALIILAIGFGIEAAWEPMSLALGLWTYELPLSLPIGKYGGRYPFAELVAGGLWFALFIMLREFRNDRGQSVVERGLHGHAPRTRAAISLAAMYALAQTIMWIPGNLPQALSIFYAPRWHDAPASVVNGVCDIPGTDAPATAYGPCPGSPGFRMPVRNYPSTTGASSRARTSTAGR